MNENNSIPEDLHPLQYGHWLAEQCGWPPVKSTIELLGDCVTSVSRKKALPLHKATRYIARAIKLAEEQHVKVDRLFFMDGEYLNLRPQKEKVQDYDPKARPGCEECGFTGFIKVTTGKTYSGIEITEKHPAFKKCKCKGVA